MNLLHFLEVFKMTIKIDKVQTEELIYEYISELREKRRKN